MRERGRDREARAARPRRDRHGEHLMMRARREARRHEMRLARARQRHETHEERRERARRQGRERRAAMRRGLRLFGWSLRTWPALAAVAVGTTNGFMRPWSIRLARALADGQRDLLEREFGTAVPDGGERSADRGLRDPAVRRDLRWLACAPWLGVLMVLPFAVVACGAAELAPALLGYGGWGPVGNGRWALLGVMFAAYAMVPGLVHGYRRWSAALLSPPRNDRLEQRVRRLTETRADAVDAQAAELRRIERDLHDGVQARLVAMGLNLGAVEQLMERDPAAAKALLSQSREASATALRELRGLVRGIHPPVLAERGLADAVRALALDSPLRTEVNVELPGRAEPPVESAVYFAVSELLTNAARHADARRVWIDLLHTGEALRVQVTDDGHGGADPGAAGGSGLRGIERRLGTFDGVLAVSSPPGGPTIVTLELPCVLSSPRTSTSFEKA